MTTQTLTLTDFLLARIAEDERHARKLDETDRRPVLSLATTVNHPQRLLAECEAKRRIVELHSGGHECPGTGQVFWDDDADWTQACPTLRILALPYVDHPDYREEWKP